MARRIAVIISQSPQNQPERRQLEEDLATKLLFERGVDVSLIPHLEHLEPGSTGLLCLEGVKGDMVVLSWLPADHAHAQLEAREIAGRMGRTRLPSADALQGEGSTRPIAGEFGQVSRSTTAQGTGPQAQRFIYHLALRAGDSPDVFLDEIQRLREETAVATVPLMLGTPAAGKKSPLAVADLMPVIRPSEPDVAQVSPESNPSGIERRTGSDAAAVSLDSEEALDAHLDALLDQFDQTEW